MQAFSVEPTPQPTDVQGGSQPRRPAYRTGADAGGADHSRADRGGPAPESPSGRWRGRDSNTLVGRRPAPPGLPANEEPFATGFRGYDRQQVDERMQELAERVDKLRIRAEAAEADLRAALSRLKEVEQAQPPADAQTAGFGVRVEKVLRLAEQEVAQVRARAAQEASELLERARADAEAHRHEVEQSLIARAAQLDHDAARRTTGLNEREQEIADKLAAAHQEADLVRASAERDAAQELSRADKRAQQVLADAEKAAQQQRETAGREVDRLAALRDGVRAEMAELHRVLAAGLGVDPQGKKGPDNGTDRSRGRSAAAIR
jgi:hypothetical protein